MLCKVDTAVWMRHQEVRTRPDGTVTPVVEVGNVRQGWLRLFGCKQRPWAVVAALLTALAIVGALPVFGDNPIPHDVSIAVQAILALLAVGWSVAAVARTRGSVLRPTVTIGAVALGLMLWTAATGVIEADGSLWVETRWWSAFHVVGIACLIVGAFLLPRETAPRSRYLYLSVDLLIAMMAAVYLAWATSLEPALAQTAAHGALDPSVILLTISASAVPLVLIWSGLQLLFGVYRKGLRVTAALLAFSYLLIAGQDLLTSDMALHVIQVPHWVGHVLRALALACALLAMAHLRWSAREISRHQVQTEDAASVRWPWRSLVALAGLWGVYAIYVIGAERYATDNVNNNYTVAAALFGILFALSGVQQVIDVFDRVRLARRLQAELTQRETAEAQLQSLNAELEERVAIRTGELADANDHLRHEIEDRRRAESALRESEARLLHDAFHDALTGLPNRALLLDRIGRALERARRHIDYRFALLFLDFDGFRVINDSLGHTLGDAVLIENARRLQSCLRGIDTLARLGGDEFVILIDDIADEAAAVAVAERLQTALALPYDGSGQRLYTTACIGIVLSSAYYETAQDLLRDAEVTMYHAKALGRSRHAVFNAGMRARAIARLVLENELRQALERNELCLHYQPILDLRTDRITGFEALVRWRHPYRGLVPPSEFIPIAEETGSIVPIGNWVLREAAGQLARWRQQTDQARDLTMSVNLSARQFREKDLASQVGLALMQAGLEPEALKVEITETVLVDDAEQALATLDALRALGVQVQIDDFGTGYSSLSYLQRFPVDTLKIDRSFIRRISAGDDSVEIVRSIVNLAHGLGLTVIAEGVETQEQLNFIKALACELGQGYLISKPLEVERAFEYIVRPAMSLLTTP